MAAFVMVLRHQPELPDGSLCICHGLAKVDNPESDDYGERVPHAWVELTIDGQEVVLDASNPKVSTCIATVERYYERQEVSRNQVRRYSPDEALQIAIRLGHNGPWHRPIGIDFGRYWAEEDERRVLATGEFAGYVKPPTAKEAKRLRQRMKRFNKLGAKHAKRSR